MRFYFSILLVGFFLAISTRAGAHPPKVGTLAPVFSGKTAQGKVIQLSQYRGKVVLLDFWASWCGPCREEFPFLIDFYQKNRKEPFQIIAVNIDDKIENMRNFLSKFDDREFFPSAEGLARFPILVDPTQKIPPLYDIQTMPTSVFIDQEGKIRFWHNGFRTSFEKQFQEELDTLLSEKQGGK